MEMNKYSMETIEDYLTIYSELNLHLRHKILLSSINLGLI